MARLGRTQPGYRSGHSDLGPPQVVDPVVVYPGPTTTLAPIRDIDDLERRRAGWSLRPPTVVGPVQVYPSVRVLGNVPVQINDGDRTRRATHSKIGPPQVVAAAPSVDVFPGPIVKLARAKPGDPRRQADWRLGVRLVFQVKALGGTGISLADTRSARSDGRRAQHSKLSAPAVVAQPSAVQFGIAVLLPTKRIRRRSPTHSFLLPPQIVAAPSTFVADPLRIYRTDSHRPAQTKAQVQPPIVVDPVQLYGPVDVELTTNETTNQIREGVRTPYYKLFPLPTVVTISAPLDTTVQVSLTRAPNAKQHFAKSRLSAPTVVGPVQVYPSVTTTFAPSSRLARAAHSVLRPPQVVTAVFFPRAPQVNLAPSSNLARATHPKLRAPTAVGPVQVYGPVRVELVPSHRLARVTHTRLRPPTVIFPFIPPAIAVSLRVTGREINPRRPVHPVLRPPTVITLPSDVVFIEPFDQPTPTGRTGSAATHTDYDWPTPTGKTASSPTTGAFDIPAPIGETDIPDPEV